MKKIIVASLLGTLALLTLITIPLYLKLGIEFAKLESDDPLVWESVIQKFEEEDTIHPPASDAVLFVGSSSIRFWFKLKEDLSPVPVIQRGFGGAKLRDIIHYADRIVCKYRPKAIVLFAGTNDICGRANDKSPEQLFGDFKQLAETIKESLADTKLFYLPITPTTSRWHVWPQAEKANKLISSYIMKQPNMVYLKTDTVFIDKNGLPRKDLLWWDGVHLNGEGYEQWKKIIKPELIKLYR